MSWIAIALALTAGQEWTQDGHDAQRTGFSPEAPAEPWRLAWTWNGPDASGGTGGHVYHQPSPYTPWEARTCTGGPHVYVPSNGQGFHALRKTDGSVAWRSTAGAFNVTPAYDPALGAVFAAADSGTLYKFKGSDGSVLGSYSAGAKIAKSVLLAGGAVYVLTVDGRLHKVTPASMTAAWVYEAGSAPHTLPAWSAVRNVVVYCTADLQVHAVNAADGTRRWRVKPSPLNPGTNVEFQGGWPVIAEQHGIVFVRMIVGTVDQVIWSGGGTKSKWPTTNAAIRARLQANPGLKNLFALRLDDGVEAFVPAVGPQGVEDLVDGKPRLRVHGFPVVKVVDGKELAYVAWRNGDTRDANWDARWDSHLGELLLDGSTVPGYAAGDLRFVQFEEHDNWIRITDESCPLTMAGNALFHAHWDASEAAEITDRADGLGGTRTNPVKTRKLPPVARHVKAGGAQYDAATHWTTSGMNLFDGRWKPAPGFWVYWNVYDPPTPDRTAYSEGILPRYTYVSDGLVVVEGNGGDLFVLKHSGTPLPSPVGSGGPPAAPTNLAAAAISSSSIDLSWADASGDETGFEIQRKTGAGGAWGAAGNAGVNAVAWSDSGLAATTTYVYRVRAVNAAGASAWSNEASATTSTAPAPPTLTIETPSTAATHDATSTPIALGGKTSGSGITSVAWSNAATGQSGPATGVATWTASVPLVEGPNAITVTATAVSLTGSDTVTVSYTSTDTNAPTVSITTPTAQPTWTAAGTPLAIGGTAADAVGVTQVRWTNAATGGAGVATGTTAWSASVPLAAGSNLITVVARDAAGNKGSDAITATWTPPASADTTAPVVTASAPASVGATPLSLSGTATDDVGVTTVTWSNAATGGSGTAAGTTAWSASLPLAAGANAIRIRAFDAAGNVGVLDLSVTYQAAAGGAPDAENGDGCPIEATARAGPGGWPLWGWLLLLARSARGAGRTRGRSGSGAAR